MWMGALVDRLGPLRLFILSLIPIIGFPIGFHGSCRLGLGLALYGMGSGIGDAIPVLLSKVYGAVHRRSALRRHLERLWLGLGPRP